MMMDLNKSLNKIDFGEAYKLDLARRNASNITYRIDRGKRDPSLESEVSSS